MALQKTVKFFQRILIKNGIVYFTNIKPALFEAITDGIMRKGCVSLNACKAFFLSCGYDLSVTQQGCGSIVATAEGDWFVNASGNPGLATAGSGDVLSGLIVALLAQGWPPLAAALAAVHLHGLAAERLAAAGSGPAGLTAGETIAAARAVFNAWLSFPSFSRDVPCHPESSASCCSPSRSCSSPSSTPARNT